MDAQTLANLLTAGMGVATVWMAIETRRMATAAKASIDLAARPYLALRGTYLSVGTLRDLSRANAGAVRVGVRLYNPGKVLVNYEVERMVASLAGHTVANPVFENVRGVLHPEEEITYFYPMIPTPQVIAPPAEGQVDIQVNYWAIEKEKQTVKAKFRILLTSPNNHEWILFDGPTYA